MHIKFGKIESSGFPIYDSSLLGRMRNETNPLPFTNPTKIGINLHFHFPDYGWMQNFICRKRMTFRIPAITQYVLRRSFNLFLYEFILSVCKVAVFYKCIVHHRRYQFGFFLIIAPDLFMECCFQQHMTGISIEATIFKSMRL